MFDDTDFSKELKKYPAFKPEAPVGRHTFIMKGLSTFTSRDNGMFYSFNLENDDYQTSFIMKPSNDENMFKFLNVYKDAFMKFADKDVKKIIDENWNSWANIKIACDAMHEDMTLITLDIEAQPDSKYTKKTFVFPEVNNDVPFESSSDDESKDEDLF